MSFVLFDNKKINSALDKIEEFKHVSFHKVELPGDYTLCIDDSKTNIERNSRNNVYTVGHAFFENDLLMREFGIYCAIEHTNNNIYIYSDLLGYYPVFYAQTKDGIVVSDRLELIKAVCSEKLNINVQACTEFIFGELISNNETLFTEIKRLGTLEKIVLANGKLQISEEQYPFNEVVSMDTFLAHYKKYIALIEDKYKGYVVKLSGGYDSRLNLSLFMSAGAKNLELVTVNINHHDESVAKQIAASNDLSIRIVDGPGNLLFSSKNNNSADNIDDALKISGQCGELSRGYYYSQYKTEKELNKLKSGSNYYLAVYPLHKLVYMSGNQKKVVKQLQSKEVERLSKKTRFSELYRVFDYVYLNRARSQFAFRLTDPTSQILPSLVDPVYFRFRLNYSFDDIIKCKSYTDVFLKTVPGLMDYPFKEKKRWYHTTTFLKVRRVLPFFSSKGVAINDAVLGITATNHKIFNQKSTLSNYKFVKAIIK